MALNLENNKPAQTKAIAKQKAATYTDAASAGSPGGPSVNTSGTLGPQASTLSQKVGTGAATAASAASSAGTALPKTATVAPPPVSPYLNPTQIAAYTSAYGGDENTINGAAGNRATLTNTFNQNSAKNGASAQNSFNNTNQSDAARGFGFSGIHDNAMSDIQANAVMNQSLYNTAYQTGLGTLAANVTNAQNNLGQLGLEYSGIAGENAQTDAVAQGTTVAPGTYTLPTVTAPATAAPPPVTAPPVTYFNNPNMGAVNSSISNGAAAGPAAGAPS